MGKEESESKFGFKNKEKAEETIKLLAEHDMQYQKLTVRGLLGRAKRVLQSKNAEISSNAIKCGNNTPLFFIYSDEGGW